MKDRNSGKMDPQRYPRVALKKMHADLKKCHEVFTQYVAVNVTPSGKK